MRPSYETRQAGANARSCAVEDLWFWRLQLEGRGKSMSKSKHRIVSMKGRVL